MPETENNRRNLQKPVLENPSLPNHDRTKDEDMHQVAAPSSYDENAKQLSPEEESAAPDQEFEQLIFSGTDTNGGRIPEDPNNRLTSDFDPAKGEDFLEDDPESRGESVPDDDQGSRS